MKYLCDMMILRDDNCTPDTNIMESENIHDNDPETDVLLERSALYGGTSPFPSETRLCRVFEEAVATRAERAAVTGLFYSDEFTSYNEVNRRANRAARVLLEKLTSNYEDFHERLKEKELTIAVDIEPCVDLLVALLAVLKLGGAYVPVDSRSAINRVRYVLNEAQPMCVLIDKNSAFQKDTNTVWSQFFILDFSTLGSDEDTDNEHCDNISNSEIPRYQNLFSIIYTSGSTGKPKGVCLNHCTVYNRLHWQWNELPFGCEEVACFKTSLLFVDSIVEIFGSMLKLVSLVISPKNTTTNPESLVNLLEEYHVTRLVMVPSMLRSLLFYLSISGEGNRLPELQLWMSNSETLPSNLLEKFFTMFNDSGRAFANIYGSTETMADVTYELYHGVADIRDKSFEGNLSIGRPMYNNWLYIVDEDLEILPKGQLGEICIAGHNVASGYLDSGVTSSNFVDNPHSSRAEYRVLYKTGDFGRIIDDRVIYEGRRDLQVKIRGQRVNIREIEQVIQECPEVDRTIVLCHKFSDVSTVIVAYYTMAHKKLRRTMVESRLMDGCRKSLPIYMRPKLLHVEEIPLQPYTGKVDRIALRKLYECAFNRQSSIELAVLDEKGRKALNIIAMNLNFLPKSLPMNSSFFECGGNSISMMSTIVTLKEHGLHIPIDVFSSAKTIQDIIDHVELSTGPIGETLRTDKYEVMKLLDVASRETIIDVLTDSFIEKEPLDTLLGVTRQEFIQFARSLYQQATQSDLSLVVLDKASGDIVGGDFLFDYFRGVMVEHHESMEPILRLFREFEEPVKTQLLADNPAGKLMFNFCLCVHKDLPHADQVRICHLIEGHVLQTAGEAGFIGVVTNNTNPVTQDICQYFYGYQLVSKYLVRDFDFNGRKVFAHAADDYYIKMMIKYL